MNTENNMVQPPQENVTADSNIQAPQPPEMSTPQSKTRLSTLKVAVIILVVLAVMGGTALFVNRKLNQPSAPSSDSLFVIPTISDRQSGLKLSRSDDPEILEQELNDTDLENLDMELSIIEAELTNL